jgi:hypothetical protein
LVLKEQKQKNNCVLGLIRFIFPIYKKGFCFFGSNVKNAFLLIVWKTSSKLASKKEW